MANGLNVHRFGELAETVKGRKPHRFVDYSEKSEPYLTADVLRGESLEPKFVPHGDDSGQNVVVGPTESIILWDGAGAGDVFPGRRGILASTMAKVVIKNSSTLLDRYLFLCLQHLETEIKSACRGTTVPHVSPEALNALPIPLPEIREQKRIVDLVSSVDTYIDALEQQAETARRARSAVLNELLSAGGDDWTQTTLNELVLSGVVLLGRGNVISKKDMEVDPGPYPVYSSAQNNDGRIGSYNKFMFDEELITWSVDGGGHVFYRPHHKFSVTNIGGYLRILDSSKFLYPFLAAVLQKLHGQHVFDWQNKAHPSVIRKLYNNIPLAPLAEQRQIVDTVSSIDKVIQSTEQAVANAKTLRSGLLSDLLSGSHEIPETYDRLLGAA